VQQLQKAAESWEAMRLRLGTFWRIHLVRATRATSSIIAEGCTLSFGLLVGKCHFEEDALVMVLETFAMAAVTSTM
jgi:hypothetical protein